MSKKKKKIITTTDNKNTVSSDSNRKTGKKAKKKVKIVKQSGANKLQATTSRSRSSSAASMANKDLLFGRKNYILVIGGFALILLGMLLMAGGHQPVNEWNESEIYSFRRITLAPIIILAGLAVNIYAIFAHK